MSRYCENYKVIQKFVDDFSTKHDLEISIEGNKCYEITSFKDLKILEDYRENIPSYATDYNISISCENKDYNFYIFFYLHPLPGCCGIMVLHNISKRGKFDKKMLVNFIDIFVRDMLKFSYLLCTDRFYDNKRDENPLVKPFNLKEIECFTNLRSGNRVGIYSKKY